MDYKVIQTLSMKSFLLCSALLLMCKCVTMFIKINFLSVQHNHIYGVFFPDKIMVMIDQTSYFTENMVMPLAIIWAASSVCRVLRKEE